MAGTFGVGSPWQMRRPRRRRCRGVTATVVMGAMLVEMVVVGGRGRGVGRRVMGGVRSGRRDQEQHGHRRDRRGYGERLE